MTSKNNSKITAWAIVAIVGLLLLNGYQWFNNNQIKSQLQKQQTEMLELERIQAELEQEYQTALTSLE